MSEKSISIIVPTLNEAGNVRLLIRRIHRAFEGSAAALELVFVDDHSTDGTREILEKLKTEFGDKLPIRIFLKQGKKGKAYSLIEGFEKVSHPIVAMIDADLQYPPEALPAMADKLWRGGADVIVARRVKRGETFWRSLLSRGFAFFFGKSLHGLDCDVQSGLKVFRKKILREVKLNPSPWTFDLEFLLSARNYGYVIQSVNINFDERHAGVSKLSVLQSIFEIGWSALKLRFRGRPPLLIHPEKAGSMRGAGVAHKQVRFVTHSTLKHHTSALTTFVPWQRNFLLGVLVLILVGLAIDPIQTGIFVVGFLTFVYFSDMVFNLYLVGKSLKSPPEIVSSLEEIGALDNEEATLPVYSVLCPLYKEAHMLPGFVGAMEKLDWPKDKLDILLLLEENDEATVTAARAMNLPSFVKIVVVPHSLPKTKPKACNYGLSFASGEYVVIYDAEDIPDPLQLKKAYLGFRKSDPSVRCLQAKLNYFNPHQNLLTRFFTAEYSLWFDVILPGLQSLNTSIPLGGTSNHFRTRDLLELEGWDPFNVTEDCDLGVRIFKRGYRTAMIESVTLEEANSDFKNWLRQRSRWIKGYMQTYLVHMRHPLAFLRENGWHALIFQLVVGGKIAFMIINPLLWLATLSYFTLFSIVGPTLQALYPPAIFYFAATTLVFGNFLYLYYYMIGAAKREHYRVIKYVFLVPFYWLMVSLAAVIAFYQLVAKPHYWEKTHHGLAKGPSAPVREKALRRPPVFHRPRWAPSFSFRLPALQMPFVWSFKRWLVSPQGFFLYAILLSNVLNFVFNAYLGRVLSFEELGLITFVNTLWYLVMIFFSAYGGTVNHQVAYLAAATDAGHSRLFFTRSLGGALKIMLAVSLLWLAAAPLLSRFFQVESVWTLLFFTPVFTFGLIASASHGFLRGAFRFKQAGLLFILEALAKLVLAFFLVSSGLSVYAYLAIPLSIILSAFLAFYLASRASERPVQGEIARPFPRLFFLAALLSNVSAMIFLSVDMLLVKHYLDPETVGKYALLSLIGKMIFFMGSLSSTFLMTYVSRNEGLAISSKKIFSYTYSVCLLLVTVGVLAFGFFGHIFGSLLFGEKIQAIAEYLPLYTMALGIFTLTGVTITYHLARREYIYTGASLLGSLCMAFGISVHHGSLAEIVWVILFSSAFSFLLVEGLNVLGDRRQFLVRAFRDLWEAFPRQLPQSPARLSGGQRILIFNWRDLRHVFAGGAELYIEELARAWVREGNQVTLFCGNDGHSPRSETIEGVEIIRRGGFYLVYLWAFVYYFLRFRGRYDVIVDCQNGIPFFTPLYAKETVYCLMHHVHQEVFRRSLWKPLAVFASFLEKGLMPLVYRDTKFITVSGSSKQEMEEIGLGRAGIEIVNPGVHIGKLSAGEKTPQPTILYLGRLKAYKSVDVLLRAFRLVLEKRPEATLVIAGGGEEESYLKRLAADLRLSDSKVQFLGRVSEENKVKLLQSSWVLVNPSFMEGWGIVIIEANACGTPVVASDIPGLRDSVRNDSTGYLVEYGDSPAFAERILTIIRDAELRETMAHRGRTWAESFDWQKSSAKFLSVMVANEDSIQKSN